uniref:Chromo domain-containing protein n=1 Tax=Glossina morsitans morsitans TaxID=37546 RepID=A0A1B0FKV9_GLOMM
MENLDENPQEYIVERVEGKRIVDGRVQYLLKWSGYDSSANTWEPVENLNCPDLVARFEETAFENEFLDEIEAESRQGLEPLKILGLTLIQKRLIFLMQWKDEEGLSFLTAAEAYSKYPQLVIKFYEERVMWDSDEEDDDAQSDNRFEI